MVRGGTTTARSALAIVETAYSLEGTDTEWLARVLETAAPDLDHGRGTYGFTCRIGEGTIDIGSGYAERGLDPRISALVGEINRNAPGIILDMLSRSAVLCGPFNETLGPEHPGTAQLESMGPQNGFVDGFSMLAQDGEGYAIDLTGPSPTRVRAHPRVLGIWRRVAVHLASAMRLRRRLAGARASRDAVLAPDGAIAHAEGSLRRDGEARDALARAVRRVERARSAKERSDPERALALWHGLVAGEWSLVDCWESDGRRYVAAYKNRPEVRDPRVLTPRERVVLRYAALGASTKEIAFTLGLSVGAVATAVSQILRKLRCRRRSDLVAFADPSRASHLRVALGAGELGVLALPHGLAPDAAARLSAGERAIAALVVEGATNAAIAEARRTSPHTVANQVRRIFEKLGVGSRAELVRALTRSE